LVFLRGGHIGPPLQAPRTPWTLGLSLALFALSLLARPVALGLPVALFAVDWLIAREKSVRRIVPFVALAVAAAFVESAARPTAPLADVGIGARLTLAATAPFKYLWRTAVPLRLTPLDPLALAPRADVSAAIAGGIALVAISWAAWRWRDRHPGAAVAWWSYLALLAPAIGL